MASHLFGHPFLLASLALLVVALLPLAHVAYAAWVRRRFPLAGESFVHAGARLHYTRSGAGPAVVLVHGANGTWNDFPPELVAELARDHTVLALHQPWHPERAPRGWGASRAFAYVPSQMHASARNFRALRADLHWLETHLPQLKARLTVLAGEYDRVTPPARHVDWLRRALPSAHIEVMPSVGHWLPRLRPDAVARAVRANGSAQAPDAAVR